MRAVKFRGLDIKRKEWVYGFFVAFGLRTFIIEGGKPGIPQQQIEVFPNTIGQFTGLYDKNGTEIFEGDIIKETNSKLDPKPEYALKQIAVETPRVYFERWINISGEIVSDVFEEAERSQI